MKVCRLATTSLGLRQIGLRIGQVNVSIRMDIRHEDFPLLLQALQQFEGLSV